MNLTPVTLVSANVNFHVFSDCDQCPLAVTTRMLQVCAAVAQNRVLLHAADVPIKHLHSLRLQQELQALQ